MDKNNTIREKAYSAIDSDTREIIEVMTNVKLPKVNKISENGEERYNMIKSV